MEWSIMDNIESICKVPFAIVPFAITGTLILFTTKRTKCSCKGCYHYTLLSFHEDTQYDYLYNFLFFLHKNTDI